MGSTPSFRGEVKLQLLSFDFMSCKNSLSSISKKILQNTKFIISFAHSSCLLPDDSAGRIVRDLWWMDQEFSSVDFIPPWFSMLIYHLEDEQ
jgi:hypothetical protein